MVARVAKAIWEKQRAKIGDPNGLNPRLIWKDKSVPAQFWLSYEEYARAAIAAMREPTKEMVEAGQEAIDEGKNAAYVWRLMNQIALK